MSKFITDFNNLNKIGEKNYASYTGKNYMCNRCLHIIKTNQQIGWSHNTHKHYTIVQYQTVNNFAYNMRLYIIKEIYLNQNQNLDKINQPTNPFSNPLH